MPFAADAEAPLTNGTLTTSTAAPAPPPQAKGGYAQAAQRGKAAEEERQRQALEAKRRVDAVKKTVDNAPPVVTATMKESTPQLAESTTKQIDATIIPPSPKSPPMPESEIIAPPPGLHLPVRNASTGVAGEISTKTNKQGQEILDSLKSNTERQATVSPVGNERGAARPSAVVFATGAVASSSANVELQFGYERPPPQPAPSVAHAAVILPDASAQPQPRQQISTAISALVQPEPATSTADGPKYDDMYKQMNGVPPPAAATSNWQNGPYHASAMPAKMTQQYQPYQAYNGPATATSTTAPTGTAPTTTASYESKEADRGRSDALSAVTSMLGGSRQQNATCKTTPFLFFCDLSANFCIFYSRCSANNKRNNENNSSRNNANSCLSGVSTANGSCC